MTTQINQLTELTTTSDDDLILIREDSTGIDKKMRAQNIRAKATTKADVGLGNVTNDAQFKLADAGTMATQNANDVAVTGGTINNTPIGGTTASTGAFTTASASTSVTTPLVTNAGTLDLSATGSNIITASTDGQERMRITSAGNVGIGTSVPLNALSVANGALTSQNIRGVVETSSYVDLELARFSLLTRPNRNFVNRMIVGNFNYLIGALRGAAENHQRHEAAKCFLSVIAVRELSVNYRLYGKIEKIESTQFQNGASGSLSVALALQYSIDNGTNWVDIPNDGSGTVGIDRDTAALIRVKASLSGSTPTAMSRISAHSSFVGNQDGMFTVNTIPTILT